MAKARARCLPMNLTPGDVLGVLKDRERARDRQAVGSSLADVDPMTIDNKVTKKEHISNSHLFNKGRFCKSSQIDTLISKQLSVENRVKLSQQKGQIL